MFWERVIFEAEVSFALVTVNIAFVEVVEQAMILFLMDAVFIGDTMFILH